MTDTEENEIVIRADSELELARRVGEEADRQSLSAEFEVADELYGKAAEVYESLLAEQGVADLAIELSDIYRRYGLMLMRAGSEAAAEAFIRAMSNALAVLEHRGSASDAAAYGEANIAFMIWLVQNRDPSVREVLESIEQTLGGRGDPELDALVQRAEALLVDQPWLAGQG